MAAFDSHPSASTSRRSERYGNADIGPRALPGRWRSQAELLAAAGLALGVLGGTIVGASMAGQSAHRRGACAALHMAAAHGFLDNRQQRVVMHTLATATNPDVDFFPGGFRAMERACAQRS